MKTVIFVAYVARSMQGRISIKGKMEHGIMRMERSK